MWRTKKRFCNQVKAGGYCAPRSKNAAQAGGAPPRETANRALPGGPRHKCRYKISRLDSFDAASPGGGHRDSTLPESAIARLAPSRRCRSIRARPPVKLNTLMKIGSCSQGQFLQADFVTEFLHAAKATFYYCLTVAFIKVVGAEVGISLFAS